MTSIKPILTPFQLNSLPSRAEKIVYLACNEGIGENRMVIFSLPWISVTPYGTARDGETDFIVFDKHRGILIIEVKGGGVRVEGDTNKWFSVDRNSKEHVIKDPFRQSITAKYALLNYLKSQAAWQRLQLMPTMGHAVLFPDIDKTEKLAGPDRPVEIMGGRTDIAALERWVDRVFDYWSGDKCIGLGDGGIEVIDRIFFRDIEVRPLLSVLVADEELERIRLTDEQARVLSLLGQRARAVVSGGAGTGKTLLAVQKARDLAEKGNRTLLVCYNRPLAEHLASCCEGVRGLEVMSFHQLCYRNTLLASDRSGVDLLEDSALSNPGEDKFDVHYPHALAMSSEILDDRYDAIIVDEAQDFGQEYWFPIELLLANTEKSTLFLFYDHNQAIYSRVSTFPISDEPFLLTRNCRNTRHIHEAAYQYYSGEKTDAPSITGSPLEIINSPSKGSQAKKIHALVSRLIAEERIAAHEIAVVVPGLGHEDYYSLLRDLSLPRPCGWSFEKHSVKDGVRVDTWKRFKGLEATILIFWGLDELDPVIDRGTLYVTLSRAKSRLYLVGRSDRCSKVLDGIDLPLKS